MFGNRFLFVVFIALAAMTMWQGAAYNQQQQQRAETLSSRLDDASTRNDVLAARFDESRAQTGELISQVRGLGERPVVASTDVPLAPSAAPASVESAVVRGAVVDYFSRFPIQVPGVALSTVRTAVAQHLLAFPPDPGRAPSDREIAEAVAAWLTENPPPAGPAGEDGAAGSAGKDGAAGREGKDGLPGRSITGAVVRSCELVLSYSDGTTQNVGAVCGPAGPPGRGIETLTCVDGALVVRYTDGQSESVTGSSCSPLPATAPTD